MAIIIVPFAMFYYEGEEYDEEGKAPSQLTYAIKGTIIAFIVFAIITVVLYLFLGFADIPVIRLDTPFQFSQNRTIPQFNGTTPEQPYFCNIANYTAPNPTGQFTLVNGSTLVNVTLRNDTVIQILNGSVYQDTATCFYYSASDLTNNNYTWPLKVDRTRTHVQFRVTFILFIITIIVFFGWLLLIIFGGIGLVAFPLDCIQSWRRRPVRIPLNVYMQRKKEIGDQATGLLAKGKVIQERQRKGRERKRDRKNYNKFRQAVFLLEEDYERLQLCYKRQGGKIILYFLTLVVGVLSVFITILWLLHILLYVFFLPYPITTFLNTVFIKLDDAWGLLGTIAYGIFSFYLLVCVVKGNFKFGMRLFFLFPIHPMRVGGTLMNAFLFNVALILIAAFSVTHFCSVAFADYTAKASINSMFALAVQNMYGLKYIFVGYVYVLFIMAFLTGIYFAVKPRDRPPSINDIN